MYVLCRTICDLNAGFAATVSRQAYRRRTAQIASSRDREGLGLEHIWKTEHFSSGSGNSEKTAGTDHSHAIHTETCSREQTECS